MIFEIAKRKVDSTSDPLIIAEIGINHNGKLDAAIAIADSAIKAGAEMLKHQTHLPDEEMSLEAKKAIPGNSKKSRNSDDNHNQKMTVIEIDPPPVHHLIGLEN